MHSPVLLRISPRFSFVKILLVFLGTYFLGLNQMVEAATTNKSSKKVVSTGKISPRRPSKAVNSTPQKVHVEIRAQDSSGNPESISGMQASLRLVTKKNVKPIIASTPFSIWINAGTYMIQVAPPQGPLAQQYKEAASYLPSSPKKVILAPKKDLPPIIIQVAKRATPSLPIGSEKPIAPGNPPTLPVEVKNIPSTTLDPISKKEGTGIIFLGAESKTPLDPVLCLVDKNQVDCSQFFSAQGLEVPVGIHTFSFQKGPFVASATQEVKANQSYNILFKLTGKLRLDLTGSSVKAVQVVVSRYLPKDKTTNIDTNPNSTIPFLAKEVTLPTILDLPAGEYKVQVSKEGYHSFNLPQVEIPAFETAKASVEMNADPDYQEKMCGLCAQNNGKSRTTILLSLGTPDGVALKAMMGVADFTKHIRLDVGLSLNSSYYLTVAGGTAQVQFVNFPKLAVAGRIFLGGGGGPDNRTNVTFEVGPIFTWSPMKELHLSLSPYFQVFQDGLPASIIPENTIRNQQGYRGIIAPSIEVSLNRFLNLGVELQFAPGTHRSAFTSEYTPHFYRATDDLAGGGFYGRVAFTLKLPPLNPRIQ